MVKFMGIKCSLYGTMDEVGRAKTTMTCYKIEFDLVKERMDSGLKIKQTNSIVFTHTLQYLDYIPYPYCTSNKLLAVQTTLHDN